MTGVGAPVRRKHEEAMALREKGRNRRGAGRKEAARACGRWSPAARFAGAAVLEEEERSGAAASRKMAGRWRRCSGPSWSRSSEEGLGDEGDRVLQVGSIAENEGGGRCDLVGWNGSGGIPRRMWERRSGGGAMGSMGQVS